ncbi:non-ribosomal peptide synthetase [Streptomyces sp. I05A-00742]|uniref:non-ribosomal peptide synthetase n=1 Tax=Streptomyces sp. I05A-00742 TaxID=2732853 RepID=UPI00148970DF|nr:non-ribosomal peptide synthetase [Streptomyces sp. I05A-00742]
MYRSTTGRQEPIGTDEPLHLESLAATAFRSALEARWDTDLPLDFFFGPRTLREIARAAAGQASAHGRAAGGEPIRHAPLERFEPFALTDVQQAYWLGSRGFELGGRSAHFYLELDISAVPAEQVETAFRRLVERHDMLRAVMDGDGRQRVLPVREPYRVAHADLSGCSDEDRDRLLAETRDRLAHQRFDQETWPLYEVRTHTLAPDLIRLHFSVDLLFVDAGSIRLLLGEWIRLMLDPRAELPALGVTFRDYVSAREARRGTPRYAKARDYWLGRLAEIPAAPGLPLVERPGTDAPRFVRRRFHLDAERWRRFSERAADLGVTPSALLCTAYAAVLRTWSKEPRFTVNVTLADRPYWHPDLPGTVGDFTSTVLLDCDLGATPTLDRAAAALQRRLREDLEHSEFSGVRVQREMARGGRRATMPVVFTSLLQERGSGVEDLEGVVFTERHAVSQTPQVHLDNQVVSLGNGLSVSWDAVDDVFPDGVLDDMFAAYRDLLESLADDPGRVHGPAAVPLPDRQLAVRRRVNATEGPRPVESLHAAVDRRLREHGEAPAVITPERVVSRRELDDRAAALAEHLIGAGVRPGAPVAVVMHKGWEQVVAVLGILRAGAAYLPVDAGLPPQRVAQLLAAGQTTVAVTQNGTEIPTPVRRIVVDGRHPAPPARRTEVPVPPDAPAYIIFTSGSTGEPKGVVIPHAGAVNTVDDINRRFHVGERDRVLGLSSLSFDLSVYDIFGVLGAGGALVLPAPEDVRDPARWAGLVDAHGVTVWNTVPALMELLTEHTERRGRRLPESLRLVMLSGDWIPLSLPDRIRAVSPGEPQIISLGGATEASIWSIAHPVDRVSPTWRSIPYGTPLRNQTFHVLDDGLRPRPDHVTGELYIGGVGLASGYWRDEERTAERFPVRPGTGERLYRTGDLGRYGPDGTLEFLGREDLQVKIGGHRIELGEIEAVLARITAVRAAVVTAVGPERGARRLVAYVVPQLPDRPPTADELRAFVSRHLPSYMVPGQFVTLETLPLSPNGKVDRAGLPEPGQQAVAAVEPPANERERTMAGAWAAVLSKDAAIGRHDDFFEAGGDSLLGVRVLARAAQEGLYLTPQEFFSHRTVAEQAALARTSPANEAPQGLVEGPVGLTPSQHWFFEQSYEHMDHWNGMWPVFVLDTPVDATLLSEALRQVLRRHDALRTRFRRVDGAWQGRLVGEEALDGSHVVTVDLGEVPDAELEAALRRHVAERNGSLDLADGPTVLLTCFDLGPARPPRLLVSAHWLVMDYYSSRVFYEDLRTAYFQLESGREVSLPPKTAPVTWCVERLAEHAASAELAAELPLWSGFAAHPHRPVPVDLHGENVQSSAERLFATVTGSTADTVLTALPRTHGVEVREVLLTALLRTFTAWTGSGELMVELEGHGREPAFGDLDISRTVARLSTLSPMLLRRTDGAGPLEELFAVRDQLRAVPHRGIGYGLLRYLHPDPGVRASLARQTPPDVGFNFWGDVSEYFTGDARPVEESFGYHRSSAGHRPRVIDLMALSEGGEIRLVWNYSIHLHTRSTIESLARSFGTQLDRLAAEVRTS